MIEKRNEIEIQGNVEEVWEALTNFTRYSEWNPLIYRVTGKLETGRTVVISVKMASRERNYTCKITRLDPRCEFSWKFHMMLPFLYRGEHIFRIEPIDEKKVYFIDREIFKGLLSPLLVKDSKTHVSTAMISMGKALKERVEKQ